MLIRKLKPRKCRLKGCSETFAPATDWQRYCCADHRIKASNARHAAIFRKGRKAVEREIGSKAVGE